MAININCSVGQHNCNDGIDTRLLKEVGYLSITSTWEGDRSSNKMYGRRRSLTSQTTSNHSRE
ncbi:hypothetical protein [Anabaena sp. 4-3]|uniref:hypothetical protein n=1 Tax=Anabaena sp. 4-3 TaxID=1811979 RepID=UPI0012E8ACB3|nr:hypothetical protein [Anabaena sp. 4-3]